MTPKFGRPLPDILTTDEIDSIIATVDMRSTMKGLRDSAMLEVLYSCGLRVSELTSLRLSGPLFRRRIHPRHRQRQQTAAGADQFNTARDKHTAVSRRAAQRHVRARRSVFLNNRGGQLTRVMVFTILKQAARRARGHRQAHQSPYLPPLVRHTPARRRRQHTSGAGDAGTREHPHHRNLHPPRSRAPAAHGRGAFTDITPEIEKSDRRPPLPRPPALFAHPNAPRFSFREEDGVRWARIRQPHNFRICDCGVSRSES